MSKHNEIDKVLSRHPKIDDWIPQEYYNYYVTTIFISVAVDYDFGYS